MGDTAGVDNRGADVIDQLLLYQMLAVPDRIEYFTHRQRRHGVLANDVECALVFCRGGVFQPEQPVWLQITAQARGFDRRESMMGVVQQLDRIAVIAAQLLK